MPDPTTLRTRRVGLGALCLVAFAVLAVLVRVKWQPLQDLDTRLGTWPEAFTATHHAAYVLAHAVAVAFLPTFWIVGLVVVGAVLASRGHRRAGIWMVGVTLVTWLLAHVLKVVVGRARPVWKHPAQVLSDPSFPSGHAAQIAASMGVVIVLVTMLVRRRGVRRVAVTAAVLTMALVALDRVFLGVHNPSDVLAGLLLGGSMVFLGMVVFDPSPRLLAVATVRLQDAVPTAEHHLGVVLNPSKVDDPEQFRALVESLAADAGLTSVTWWETTVEDTGHGMAHGAAVAGSSLVLAVGGDGTIRAVCEELAGTGIPVGIVPAGTGNLLARNLDIPLYLRTAVDVALNGQDRAIDMVEVSGDAMDDAVFLVMAGMGFDAAIMEGVNEHVKARVGWLAYVFSAFKSLMFPTMRVQISLDGAEFTTHRARTIVVGNVGSLQAGMPLIPDAAIDDGQLDVVLLYPRRFLSWVPLAARVLTRNTRTDELITRMTGREVLIRAAKDEPRQLDGDLIAPGREIRATCLHGRLLVRVPR